MEGVEDYGTRSIQKSLEHDGPKNVNEQTVFYLQLKTQQAHLVDNWWKTRDTSPS